MSTQAFNEGQERSGAIPGFIDRVLSAPRRFRQHLHEVRVEMRQTTWPTRDDVKATTLVVIVTVFFFGAYLALVDYGIGRLVNEAFKFFKQ